MNGDQRVPARVRAWLLLAALLAAAVAFPQAYAASLASHAIVRADGSLRIRGRTVRLAGVYLPRTGRACRARISPVRCAPRAALALDGKVRGLVR